jgi:hypothetical protein
VVAKLTEMTYYSKFTKVMVQVGDEPDERTDYAVVKARSRGLAAAIAKLLNWAIAQDIDLDELGVLGDA